MEGPWTIWQREQQHQPPVSPVPSSGRLVLKRICNAVGWQNHPGVFCAILASLPGNTWAPQQCQGSEGSSACRILDWMWKLGLASAALGGFPSQCKVSLSPQKSRSWHLFNHPLIPNSCCELIIVCKSENTQYDYVLKNGTISLFKIEKCKDVNFWDIFYICISKSILYLKSLYLFSLRLN